MSKPLPRLRLDHCGSSARPKKTLPGKTVALLLTLLTASYATADITPAQSMNFSGYTGLFHVPNADVVSHGQIDAQLNDFIHLNDQLAFQRGENYIFSMGVWPGLELGGRIANYPGINGWQRNGDFKTGGRRDLSGNIKYRFPVIEGWPRVAIGKNDFSGEAVNFRSRYIVASHDWWRLKVTAGAGDGPDRLNGGFAGVELAAHRNLDLLAENDGDYSLFGARLHGNIWRTGGRWYLLAKAAHSDEEDASFGLGLSIPLGRSQHDREPISLPEAEVSANATGTSERNRPEAEAEPAAATAEAQADQGMETNSSADDNTDNDDNGANNIGINDQRFVSLQEQNLLILQQRLETLGLDRVQVGTRGDTLMIRFENNVYLQNAVDGFGIAMGSAAELAPAELPRMRVTSLQRGVGQLELESDIALYRAFLEDPLEHRQAFEAQLQGRVPERGRRDRQTNWVDNDRPQATWLQLIARPDLRTYVATEFSPLEYSAAAAVDAIAPLWHGGQLFASWNEPLDTSRVYDQGGFLEPAAHQSGLTDLRLQQTLRLPGNVLNLASVGKTGPSGARYDTISNETVWRPGNGGHQLRFFAAGFENDLDSREVGIGSYRYYWQERDLALEVSYGQHFAGDRGAVYRVRRYFGDTIVSLFFKYIDSETQAGGLQLSIPLTPRRAPRLGPLVASGTNRFSYGLQTTINRADGTNTVDPSMLVEPRTTWNLVKDFYDSDRLTPEYIRQHSLRLRDIYRRHGR